jgi:hypothetical protein
MVFYNLASCIYGLFLIHDDKLAYLNEVVTPEASHNSGAH